MLCYHWLLPVVPPATPSGGGRGGACAFLVPVVAVGACLPTLSRYRRFLCCVFLCVIGAMEEARYMKRKVVSGDLSGACDHSVT